MAYDRLYQKLNTKEGEKEVFNLTRARKRKTRDLGVVRCIKGENGKVLSEDAVIKETWQRFFSELLNGEVTQDFQSAKRESIESHLDPRLCLPIRRTRLRDPKEDD